MTPDVRTRRRPLTGHSGVDLFLLDTQNGLAVRKQARRDAQNARLRTQCEKMRSTFDQGLPCPRVLDTGEMDGLFWFDMEYVAGETLGNAVCSGRALDWPAIVKQIFGVVAGFRARSSGFIPSAAFTAKLLSIVARCSEVPAAAPLLGPIGRLAEELSERDWTGISESPSHGDLTLENIILRHDGSLIFIDLDIPEQSAWDLDVGKIFQDVRGQWFLRKLAVSAPDSVDLINAQLALAKASAHFDRAFDTMVAGGRERICQLAAFHLMRTLPYCTEPTVPRFVVARIVSLLGAR
jgi:tRNA A-37 threonylcarbamoyl transferase component Bud32